MKLHFVLTSENGEISGISLSCDEIPNERMNGFSMNRAVTVHMFCIWRHIDPNLMLDAHCAQWLYNVWESLYSKNTCSQVHLPPYRYVVFKQHAQNIIWHRIIYVSSIFISRNKIISFYWTLLKQAVWFHTTNPC